MSSWGASAASDAKPKYLTVAEKRDVYATEKGWTAAAGGNDNALADREVLVAIGDLGGATATDKLDAANISSVNIKTSSFSKADGGTVSVSINFNETVTVTGTPTVVMTNNTDGARNLTLSYASGSTTNRLTFSLVIAAANAATDALDELVIGVNAMSLSGGTVTNTVGGGNALITNAAGTETLTVAT
jgi:hypothetical protein